MKKFLLFMGYKKPNNAWDVEEIAIDIIVVTTVVAVLYSYGVLK